MVVFHSIVIELLFTWSRRKNLFDSVLWINSLSPYHTKYWKELVSEVLLLAMFKMSCENFINNEKKEPFTVIKLHCEKMDYIVNLTVLQVSKENFVSVDCQCFKIAVVRHECHYGFCCWKWIQFNFIFIIKKQPTEFSCGRYQFHHTKRYRNVLRAVRRKIEHSQAQSQ